MSRYRGAVLRIVRRLGELPGLTRKQQNELQDLVSMGIRIENLLNTLSA